jgi:tetratricopeptide (TPR) repeat protein
VAQHNFAEAQSVLNQALTLNSSFPSALLYCALAETGVGDLDSAEKHMKAAYLLGGASYSIALFHLGELYMNRGERELALQAFEAYLRDSPAAPNADQVRKLISMLR